MIHEWLNFPKYLEDVTVAFSLAGSPLIVFLNKVKLSEVELPLDLIVTTLVTVMSIVGTST